MLKGSFWYPNSWKHAALFAAVCAMVVLHQSELVGLYDSTTILFGWLPAQIAYDMAFNVVGFGILIVMYYLAPTAPERYESEGESR